MNNAQDSLVSTLMRLWHKDRLGHFYMLRLPCADHEVRDWGRQWTNELLAQLAKAYPDEHWQQTPADWNELNLWAPHPDCLMLFPSGEQLYLKEDLEEFFTFVQMRPGNLKRRLLFVFEAERLGQSNLSHRLLKTLEDPGGEHCIIFITTRDAQFLSTIESRALTLRPNINYAATPGARDGADLMRAFAPLVEHRPHAADALAYLQDQVPLHQVTQGSWNSDDLLHLQQILGQWSLATGPLSAEQWQQLSQLMRHLQEWRPFHHSSHGQVALLLSTFRQLYRTQNIAKS